MVSCITVTKSTSSLVVLSISITSLLSTGHGAIRSSLDDCPSYFNMCDTLKGYVLTTNDRTNFTVNQLHMLLNHFMKQTQPQSDVS